MVAAPNVDSYLVVSSTNGASNSYDISISSRIVGLNQVREGVPVPVRGGPVGLDEGVESFNDFLHIVTRCLPEGSDPFSQAAYFWAGLHGYVALRDAIPTFQWPSEHEYIDRMIQIHISAHPTSKPGLRARVSTGATGGANLGS